MSDERKLGLSMSEIEDRQPGEVARAATIIGCTSDEACESVQRAAETISRAVGGLTS